MIKLKLIGWVYFVAISVCHADFFSASLLTADWSIKQEPSSCQLQQKIPLYGMADFTHKSGESLRFSISEERFKPEIIKASLTINAPPWLNQSRSIDDYLVSLDSVSGKQHYPRLSVYGESAENMLDALSNGLNPTFSYVRASLSGLSPEVHVAVSAINFSNNYQQFINCRKGFLPAGFKQILEKSLFFKPRSQLLSAEMLKQLNNAAQYLKDVPGTRLLIISDTAMAGNRDKNWFLKRANAIKKKLNEQGIPKDKIQIKTGFHVASTDNKVVQLKVFGPDALQSIYYRKGNTRLTATEKQRLGLLARYAESFLPDSQIIISSHTDAKGKRANNLRISQQRGDEIKRYLMSQGVDEKRLKVKAYGERKPVKSNRFPKGRAQNRRATIGFVG